MQYRPISEGATRRPHVPKHIPAAPAIAPDAARRSNALQQLVDEANRNTAFAPLRVVQVRKLWSIETVSANTGFSTLFLGEPVACIAYLRGMLDWRGNGPQGGVR